MHKNVIPSLHMEEYFARAIPNLDAVRIQKQGYRSWEINESATEYTEELIDVREEGIAGVNHYHALHNPPYRMRIPGSTEQLLVRKSVALKLVAVNAKLRTLNLELFVFDALRPLGIQNYFHDTWFPEQLRQRHPEWNEERICKEVEQYWAAGGELDMQSPPPHTTGGAIDVTLRYINGEQLWMGTIFDDVTALAHTDSLESADKELSFSNEEAQKNRRLLYWAMKEEGFQNNPTEWWHYSYGDQMWAKLSSTERAHVPALYSATLRN